MGKEIERKFLVTSDAWKSLAQGTYYRQGYLSTVKERVVRVRTIGDKGFLTIKGITVGVTRSEFEYEIPVDEANLMLDNLCEKPIIEKMRAKVKLDGLVWEIDEFLRVIAEYVGGMESWHHVNRRDIHAFWRTPSGPFATQQCDALIHRKNKFAGWPTK